MFLMKFWRNKSQANGNTKTMSLSEAFPILSQPMNQSVIDAAASNSPVLVSKPALKKSISR